MFVANARAAAGGSAEAIDVTVYLKADVPLAKARQLVTSARRGAASRHALTTADEALAEFREFSGFGAALEALQGNPLPHVINVRPAAECGRAARDRGAEAQGARVDDVELVQVEPNGCSASAPSSS